MILFQKPNDQTVQAFLATQAQREFTYSAIGGTATSPPPGFVVDHTRVRLGAGERVFNSAKTALWRLDQFDLGWVKAWSADPTIAKGGLVAVAGKAVGVWWLNACRVVYTVDEYEAPITRFGFAYGTLPGHVERGEERFLLEWNRDDDSVWYDVLAFSQPRHIMARLGRPWVRRLQRRFGPQSAARMAHAATKPAGD